MSRAIARLRLRISIPKDDSAILASRFDSNDVRTELEVEVPIATTTSDEAAMDILMKAERFINALTPLRVHIHVE